MYDNFTQEQTFAYLSEARQNMGNIDFMSNPDRVDAMNKFLGALYLYCPDELKELVYATLHEVTLREGLLLFRGINIKLGNKH